MNGPEKIVFLEAFGGRQMPIERADKLWRMFTRDERRQTHKVYDTLVEQAGPEKLTEMRKAATTFNQEKGNKCFRCGVNISEGRDVCDACDPEKFDQLHKRL